MIIQTLLWLYFHFSSTGVFHACIMRSRRLKIFFACNILIFVLTSAVLFLLWHYDGQTEQRLSNNNDCHINTDLEQVTDKHSKANDVPTVNDVAKSLKNEALYQTGGDFHQYFDKSGESDFNRPLSMYDQYDQEILKSLFPVQTKNNNSLGVSTQTGRIQKQLKLKLKYAEPKLIYVDFFSNHLQPHSVQSNQCQVDNCRITNMKKDKQNADAVIFHQLVKRVKRPKNKPHQLWIFHQLESSSNNRFVSKHHELINWTATFRSDSTLHTPYGKYVSYDKFSKLPPQEQVSSESKNYAKGKTKLAAWFVSNCGGYNGRMTYVTELQKYAHIDVYGFCGPLSCSKGNEAYRCTDMLKEDYKFYLAFENSNCRDYITEKFFHNALQ